VVRVVDIRDEERRALSERGLAAEWQRTVWHDGEGGGKMPKAVVECKVGAVRRVWVIEGGTWPMTIGGLGEAVGVGATSFLERPHTGSSRQKKTYSLHPVLIAVLRLNVILK
jgi:hypothetical protein